jgi:hypothetical protein
MGQLPKREYLVNASENNPDGYGFAVHHGDRIVTGRSMKYENLLDRFYAEMTKSKNPIGMFHARYTTHGTTMLENNHPFRVDGRKDIILAHNGMLPITPRAGDERSDTRIFAEDVLGAIGVQALDDKSTFTKLEDFASGSKIAILSTSPELRDSVYILNEHLGHWEGDIWWSNTGYKTNYSYGYGKSSSSYYGNSWWNKQVEKVDSTIIGRHWWQEETQTVIEEQIPSEVCYVCANPIEEQEYHEGICSLCNSCLDCYEHASACLCYMPHARVHSSMDLIEY